MHSCPTCNSTNLQKRGTKVLKTLVSYRQYSCNNCGKRFNVELVDESAGKKLQPKHNQRYVFTSYQKYTDINEDFLTNLKSYCIFNNAELKILTSDFDDSDIKDDDVIKKLYNGYGLTSENININDYINVYASLKLSRTAENPLSGLDALTKGKSLIVGHPTLQMETLPVFGNSHPIMMHTTGTISIPQYNEYSKAGAKAVHNHSYSALVVEVDVVNDLFHIRVLNADDNGVFTDLDTHYSLKGIEKVSVEAIVFGDTHVTVADQEVSDATFFNKDSMVNVLKPNTLVHHDVLDFGLAQSHHNKHSFIKRYKKWVDGKDSVLSELNATANYLLAAIPDFVDKVLLVSSNHNDHLTQYLDSGDIKHDYKNAKIYHFLMYKVLVGIEAGKDVNPFKFFMEEFYKNQPNMDKLRFLEREDVYYIKDILISSHGDKGVGGSFFSPTQGKKYPMKTIVGHSHCFEDGHSALTKGGWKSIKDIVVGEYVLAYDYLTNTNIWVENKQTHINKYSGVLLDVNTQYFRQVITPNHNFFTKDGKYINASEYILTNTPSGIPITSKGIGHMDSDGIDKYSDNDIRKIVAVCADAWICENKNTVRFHLKKDRKIQRLKELFGDDIKSYDGMVSSTGSVKFSITKSSQTHNMLDSFGLLDNKSLPRDFMYLSKRQKEILLEELSMWDGIYVKDESKTGRQWSSTDKNSVNIISKIITELGYRQSSYQKKVRSDSHKIQYIISWCVDRDRQWNKDYITCGKDLSRMWGVQQRKVDNIDVYCLTTDVQNFWVKNDKSGTVSLTGNSPSINSGCYQTGTMTGKLEYTIGTPSAWMNTHCVIHKTGKRQLVSVVRGKWKL